MWNGMCCRMCASLPAKLLRCTTSTTTTTYASVWLRTNL